MTTPKIIALIPARSGSKRIKDKNIKKLGDHPLIAYSIQAAIDCEIFDSVVCATDSKLYADIATYYGAEVPFLRSNIISEDNSPDIDWVKSILLGLKESGREFEYFSILRPTSPFRQSRTIERAWNIVKNNMNADSLRAIEKCSQHPGTMWMIRGALMLPLMQNSIAGEVILPFITEGLEGFDINYEMDFQAAENYILTEKNILPSIKQIPYQIFK